MVAAFWDVVMSVVTRAIFASAMSRMILSFAEPAWPMLHAVLAEVSTDFAAYTPLTLNWKAFASVLFSTSGTSLNGDSSVTAMFTT